MPLLLLTFVSVLQWLILNIPGINPEYDPTLWLLGNLQIIIMIFVYRLIKKYIKV